MSKLRDKIENMETPKTNGSGELHKSPKGGGPKRYGTMASRTTPGEGNSMAIKVAEHGFPCGMLPMLEKTAQFWRVKQAEGEEAVDDNINVGIDPKALAAVGGAGVGAAGGIGAGRAGREGFGKAMDFLSPSRRAMLGDASAAMRGPNKDFGAAQRLIDAVASQKRSIRGLGRRIAPMAGGLGGAALGAGAGYGLAQLLSDNQG